MQRILISAGDYSGEIYGVEILQRLKKELSSAQFFCLTRSIMSDAGATPVSPVSNVGVVGITEVAGQFKNLIATMKAVWRFFDHNPPHVVILIDFPDVNLHIIARLAKRKGARALYFIPPQVWAWRPGRIKLLERLIDDMIVILPFEEAFYRRHGFQKVHYFGHPVLDKFERGVTSPSRESEELTVGVLPGSRLSEWRHHIPIVNRVVENLALIYPKARFLLPVARSMERNLGSFELSPLIRPVLGSASESAVDCVLSRAHCALVASGTATLEAALWGVPMIVFYRVSPLSAMLAKKLIKLSFVSLPNLILGEKVVPEFLDKYEPGDIVKAMESLIEGFQASCKGTARSEWERQREAFRKIKDILGKPPILDKIASHIANFIRNCHCQP